MYLMFTTGHEPNISYTINIQINVSFTHLNITFFHIPQQIHSTKLLTLSIESELLSARDSKCCSKFQNNLKQTRNNIKATLM